MKLYPLFYFDKSVRGYNLDGGCLALLSIGIEPGRATVMSSQSVSSTSQDFPTRMERLIGLFRGISSGAAIVACVLIFVLGVYAWDVSVLVAGIETAATALVFFLCLLCDNVFNDPDEDDMEEAAAHYVEELSRIRSNSRLIVAASLLLVGTSAFSTLPGFPTSILGVMACFALGIFIPTRLCSIVWYWGDKKVRWQAIV
ncbi:MAG: hypothetical protein PHV93_00435 [Candidatus Pacebacteria bacterium]|nr:hypothetical protein [Candidatus Paceibacterota bacterium]